MSSPLQLPPLQVTVLDASTLAQLFSDLETCATGVTVQPRTRPDLPPALISLAEAQVQLASGSLRGVQIRYRYEGGSWCDTLITQPAGTRLVRICEDDIAASVGKEEP